MKRSNPLFLLVFLCFFVGVSGLVRFSRNVRSVDAVGLFSSGAACGAAVAAFIASRRARIKA